MSEPVHIRNVLHTDGSPASLADMLVQLVADICIKTDRDPAEGTALLMLAALKIYHENAREPDKMPESMARVVKQMAEDCLAELAGTVQ